MNEPTSVYSLSFLVLCHSISSVQSQNILHLICEMQCVCACFHQPVGVNSTYPDFCLKHMKCQMQKILQQFARFCVCVWMLSCRLMIAPLLSIIGLNSSLIDPPVTADLCIYPTRALSSAGTIPNRSNKADHAVCLVQSGDNSSDDEGTQLFEQQAD